MSEDTLISTYEQGVRDGWNESGEFHNAEYSRLTTEDMDAEEIVVTKLLHEYGNREFEIE